MFSGGRSRDGRDRKERLREMEGETMREPERKERPGGMGERGEREKGEGRGPGVWPRFWETAAGQR